MAGSVAERQAEPGRPEGRPLRTCDAGWASL